MVTRCRDPCCAVECGARRVCRYVYLQYAYHACNNETRTRARRLSLSIHANYTVVTPRYIIRSGFIGRSFRRGRIRIGFIAGATDRKHQIFQCTNWTERDCYRKWIEMYNICGITLDGTNVKSSLRLTGGAFEFCRRDIIWFKNLRRYIKWTNGYLSP